MAQNPIYLSQYNGTDATGNATPIVAEDMTTACQIYHNQNNADPVIMQRVKQHILCALPDIYVKFVSKAVTAAGAVANGCTVYPEEYTVVSKTKQIFTAKAAEGYEFVKWQIDGVDVEEATDPVAVLTIPESSDTVQVQAIFQTTE